MKVDKSLINTINKQNVINIIRNNGPIFKAEISRITGLSIPTIMKITEEFIKKKLIREIGKGESSGGKPPQLLEFIPDSNFIIGVDVGTTNIISLMMDLSSSIIYRCTEPTGLRGSSNIVIDQITSLIRKTINNSGVDIKKILGIGIGMPGLLDSEAGIVMFSPDFGWEDVDLLSPIKEKFGMPIVLENVTRGMAMGERWFGKGKNIDNFLCINLGYGIGAAVVIGGELYKGSSGTSGELGHTTLEKNGPLCFCGNYGCLEALASANAISRKAKFFIENGKKSIMFNLANGDINAIEAKTVFDAAKQGDTLANEILCEATEYIGIAIANKINFLDPELIILEGGVAKAGDTLVESLNEVIMKRQMKYAGKYARIVISDLGTNAAAIGAASLILKSLIENGGDTSKLAEYG